MGNSRNSLLGVVALGAAAYLFRNKDSRDKVMNQIRSLVTPETRDNIMNKIQSFAGNDTNSSTEKQKPASEISAKPNDQALSTAETMNQQTKKFVDSNNDKEITDVHLSK